MLVDLCDDALIRAIAQQFPGTSAWSLNRNFKDVPALIASVTAHQVSKNEATAKLPDRVQDLIAEAKAVIAAAKNTQAWGTARGGIREARACLELLGRLSGELKAIGVTAGEFIPGTGVAAAASASVSSVNLACRLCETARGSGTTLEGNLPPGRSTLADDVRPSNPSTRWTLIVIGHASTCSWFRDSLIGTDTS
jgi:hypothetical protein